MSDLNFGILLVISFLLGMVLYGQLYNIILKIKGNNIIKDINDQFKQILDNILAPKSANKTKFINRINSTVFIKTKLSDYGDVSIVYLLDKKSVAIFLKDKCIYTSESADREVIKSIIENIDKKYKKKINDVVEILGFVFSKDDFENRFRVKADDLKGFRMPNPMEAQSDIDNILHKNRSKLDMDEILDKITKVGIENLTPEEKSFLSNFNK